MVVGVAVEVECEGGGGDAAANWKMKRTLRSWTGCADDDVVV
jgi:hypothetical protein